MADSSLGLGWLRDECGIFFMPESKEINEACPKHIGGNMKGFPQAENGTVLTVKLLTDAI